jgi:hypothetical protein
MSKNIDALLAAEAKAAEEGEATSDPDAPLPAHVKVSRRHPRAKPRSVDRLGRSVLGSRELVPSVGGRGGLAGLPSSSTSSPRSCLCAGWMGQAVAGGPVAIANTPFHKAIQCSAQGQCAGRCSTRRRCGRAIRAGTLTIRRRRVAPRATACRSLLRVQLRPR